MSLKQGLSYLGVLVVGVAGGFVAGLLTAPACGDETRRRLSWRLDEKKDKVRRGAQRVVEQTATRLEHGNYAGRQEIVRLRTTRPNLVEGTADVAGHAAG